MNRWFAQDIFDGLKEDDFAIPATAQTKRKSSEEEQTNKPAKKSKTASPTSPLSPSDQVVPDDASGKKQANGKEVTNGKEGKGKKTKEVTGDNKANGKVANGKTQGLGDGKQNGKKKDHKDKRNDKRKGKGKDDFEVVPQEPDIDSDEDNYREENFREGIVADEESLDEADQVSDDEYDLDKKVQTLAIATNMLRKKPRQSIEDDMFNRYAFNDDDLPEWFTKHERRYIQPNLPITKEQVREMRERYREINSRPIKKVAEALARKKQRSTVKATKAKAKATAIAQDESLTPGQKISQVNKIMKKANQKQAREKVYVVAKKGGGMRTKRKHVKHQRVKMVDSRMKKEAKANVRAEKAGKKPRGAKGGRSKGGKSSGGKRGGR